MIGWKNASIMKNSWSEVIEKDCQTRQIFKEDAADRGQWRLLLIMVALRSRCGHYIFALWFLCYFFPRLISAVRDWISTSLNCTHGAALVWILRCRSETCCTAFAANTGRKKSSKNRHVGTIAQICRAISSKLRHVSTIVKNLLSSNISFTCSHHVVYLWPTSGWDRSGSFGHPCKFQRVLRLGSVTARHSRVRRQPNFAALTEGATYIRQGGHN